MYLVLNVTTRHIGKFFNVVEWYNNLQTFWGIAHVATLTRTFAVRVAFFLAVVAVGFRSPCVNSILTVSQNEAMDTLSKLLTHLIIVHSRWSKYILPYQIIFIPVQNITCMEEEAEIPLGLTSDSTWGPTWQVYTAPVTSDISARCKSYW